MRGEDGGGPGWLGDGERRGKRLAGVRFGLTFALEAADFGEGAEIGAVGGGDLAQETLESILTEAAVLEEAVERGIGVGRVEDGAEEFRLDAQKAAAQPVAVDEGIDEVVFHGGAGLQLTVILRRESLKLGGVLTGNDGGVSVNAVFQGIEAGSILTGLGAGAGGALGVEAIGLDLAWSGHSRTG